MGLISYSLYLWHWGVLSIGRWTIGIHWWSVPLQFAIMLLIAIASYEWIEKKTRRIALRSRKHTLLTGFTILALPALTLKLTLAKLPKALYLGRFDEYILSSNGGEVDGAKLSENKGPGAQQVTVVGNSLARNILPTIKKISEKHSLSYHIIGTKGDPIPRIRGEWIKVGKTVDTDPDLENPELSRSLVQKKSYSTAKPDPEIIQAIRGLRRNDILILDSRHYHLYKKLFAHNGDKYYQTLRGDFGEPLNETALISIWKNKLKEVILDAKRKGANVVFIAPLPEFNHELQIPALCTREWFRPFVENQCMLTESRDFLTKERFVSGMEATLHGLESEFDNFFVYNPFPVLCPTGKEYCESSPMGERLYSDNDHLSTRGALMLADHFEKYLLNHSLLGESRETPENPPSLARAAL